VILCIPISLIAQSASLNDPMSRTSQTAVQQDISLSGVVSPDAKSFVADKDSTVWAVSNPEMIKNFAGRRASVKCHPGQQPNTMQVISAKPIKAETKYAVNLGDAALRR